jgi:hypothetical protein
MSLLDQGLQIDFLLLLLLKEEASREECFDEKIWRLGILVLASDEIETSLLQPLPLCWSLGRKSAGAAVSSRSSCCWADKEGSCPAQHVVSAVSQRRSRSWSMNQKLCHTTSCTGTVLSSTSCMPWWVSALCCVVLAARAAYSDCCLAVLESGKVELLDWGMPTGEGPWAWDAFGETPPGCPDHPVTPETSIWPTGQAPPADSVVSPAAASCSWRKEELTPCCVLD